MRRIYGWILMALLAVFTPTGAKAQIQSAPPVTGQITAATTTATCTVPGATSAGSVDQQLNSVNGATGISVTGTWSATLNIVLSVDHGKTWTASGSSFTANQQSVISSAGYSDVCVYASAYTSGTAVVTFSVSLAAPSGSSGGTGASATQVQGAGAADSAAVGNPVLVAGVDASGNVQELPVSDTGVAGPATVVLMGGEDTTAAARVINTSNQGVIDTISNAPGGTDGFSNTGIGYLGTNNSSTAALVVVQLLFNGTTWDRAITCSNTSTFSVASTVTQVIAASGSTKIRICSFDINPSTATAGSADIVYGTGANCATGTTTLTGAYTLPAAAVVDITPSTLSATSPLTTPASQAVCVRAVTSTVNGFIVWEQH